MLLRVSVVDLFCFACCRLTFDLGVLRVAVVFVGFTGMVLWRLRFRIGIPLGLVDLVFRVHMCGLVMLVVSLWCFVVL